MATCDTKSCWIVCPREFVAGLNAPVLILAVARLLFSRNGKINRHAGYYLGQAIAQLAIQATSRQIYLHQMGGFSIEAAKKAFGLNQNQEPYSVIAVGYLCDPDTLTET